MCMQGAARCSRMTLTSSFRYLRRCSISGQETHHGHVAEDEAVDRVLEVALHEVRIRLGQAQSTLVETVECVADGASSEQCVLLPRRQGCSNMKPDSSQMEMVKVGPRAHGGYIMAQSG